MNENRPIKIAVMLRHIGDKGGITVYTRNILNNMLKYDRRNKYVLFFASENHLGAFDKYPNAEEVLIQSGKGIKSRLIWDQYLVLKQLKLHKVDVVFNPKLSVPLLTRCKTVFTMHGLEQFAASRLFIWHDRIYFNLAMRLYCRRADAILCMTEAGKADLQRYLGVKREKIHVIAEAYNQQCKVISDEGRLQQIREKFRLPPHFLLFVGGITPLKNIPVLLHAFQLLKDKGYKQKLVIAGFRRWKDEKDMALIHQLGLDQDVIEIGYVKDEEIPLLYILADCFVLPSFYEGFGIPILEAQACGCPVIISNPAPMKEVAGGAVLIFDPRNQVELAEKIETLLKNDDLRNSLIQKGLQNVKKYNWSITAQKTIKVLEQSVNPLIPT